MVESRNDTMIRLNRLEDRASGKRAVAAYVQIGLELHGHRRHLRIVADINQLLLDARAHERQLGTHLVQLGRRRGLVGRRGFVGAALIVKAGKFAVQILRVAVGMLSAQSVQLLAAEGRVLGCHVQKGLQKHTAIHDTRKSEYPKNSDGII
jgi:hypothetical protein